MVSEIVSYPGPESPPFPIYLLIFCHWGSHLFLHFSNISTSLMFLRSKDPVTFACVCEHMKVTTLLCVKCTLNGIKFGLTVVLSSPPVSSKTFPPFQTETAHSLNTDFHPLPSPWQPLFYFVLMNLTSIGILYFKWNHTIFVLL